MEIGLALAALALATARLGIGSWRRRGDKEAALRKAIGAELAALRSELQVAIHRQAVPESWDPPRREVDPGGDWAEANASNAGQAFGERIAQTGENCDSALGLSADSEEFAYSKAVH